VVLPFIGFATASSVSNLRNCTSSRQDTFQLIVQPKTTLLDCILYTYLMQYPYDPGSLPSSAS